MHTSLHRLLISVTLLLMLAGCAGSVALTEGAEGVQLVSGLADDSMIELGPIQVEHGTGCGLVGTLGNRQGAEALARNRAQVLGADLVRITRIVEPYSDGKCRHNEYVIVGIAYRTGAQGKASGITGASADPSAESAPSDAPPAPLAASEQVRQFVLRHADCRAEGAEFGSDPLSSCPTDRLYTLLSQLLQNDPAVAQEGYRAHLAMGSSLALQEAARHLLVSLAREPESQLIVRERTYQRANIVKNVLGYRQGLVDEYSIGKTFGEYLRIENLFARMFGQPVAGPATHSDFVVLQFDRRGSDADAHSLDSEISRTISKMRLPPADLSLAVPPDLEYWKVVGSWFPMPINRLREHRKARSYLVANEFYAADARYVRWLREGTTGAALQELIPKGTIHVDYVHYRHGGQRGKGGEARFLAFVVFHNQRGLQVRIQDLGVAEEISREVREFRRALTSRAPYEISGSILYKRLVGQLNLEFEGKSDLIISPSDVLSLVPFEALPPAPNEFLDEKLTISYGRLRDLSLESLRGTYAQATSAAGPGLILADPKFDSGARRSRRGTSRRGTKFVPSSSSKSSGTKAAAHSPGATPAGSTNPTVWPTRFQRLNGTRTEGLAIAKLYGRGARLLMGKSATESAIRAISSPQFLHIASHGYFLSPDEMPLTGPAEKCVSQYRGCSPELNYLIRDPRLRVGVALAGANALASGVVASGYEDDGILTAAEIEHLNLVGTELVVLSACSTSVGAQSGAVQTAQALAPAASTEVASLRRAFRTAGASSVVASLWNVADRPTAWLMTSFYRHHRAGLSAPKAMRFARADLRARLRSRESGTSDHPFFWAPFLVESTAALKSGE